MADESALTLQAIDRMLCEAWDRSDCVPDTLIIPWRTHHRLARFYMSKRQYRRWRGRQKAAWRALGRG